MDSEHVRLTSDNLRMVKIITGVEPSNIKTSKQLGDFIDAQVSALPETIAETKLLRRLLEGLKTD